MSLSVTVTVITVPVGAADSRTVVVYAAGLKVGVLSLTSVMVIGTVTSAFSSIDDPATSSAACTWN